MKDLQELCRKFKKQIILKFFISLMENRFLQALDWP